MHRIAVHAALSARTSFAASTAASLRVGEFVIITPDPAENAPAGLLALVDAARVEPPTLEGPSLTVGHVTIIATLAGDKLVSPPRQLPDFRATVERLPREIAAGYFGTAAIEVDPVTGREVRPSALQVGTLLTDVAVPVVFSAAGLNRHTVMLAQSGSGKSYALGVLLEEVVQRTKLRIVVVDPNGDFGLMASSIRTLPGVAGDRSAGTVGAEQLPALQTHIPRVRSDHATLTVVNLSDVAASDVPTAASMVLETLWNSREDRIPTLLVVDEAHHVAPDADTNLHPSLPVMIRIAGEGRKFGLWSLLVSQRPQKLHASLISQCDNLILMRLTNSVDLEHVASSFAGVTQDLMYLATGFGKGDALAAGKIVRSPTLFHFRRRVTPESGGDLDLGWAVQPSS